MPTGGPSIDSNAIVGPDATAVVVSDAFDMFDVVQPEASAISSAAMVHVTLRAYARFGPDLTLAPPCRDAEVYALVICRDLGSAKSRKRPANYFDSAIALT